MKFNDKKYYGTGCIIGLNMVLTCAHNCFHGVYGRASKLVFYPTLNGVENEEYRVAKFYYPTEYEQEDSEELDFAILELERDVGTKYGILGLDFTDKKEGEEISVCDISGKYMIIEAISEKDPPKKRLNGEKGRWIRY